MINAITSFITGFFTWITDTIFKAQGNAFWYFIIWTVAVYLAGAFTGPYIPYVNRGIYHIHKLEKIG